LKYLKNEALTRSEV